MHMINRRDVISRLALGTVALGSALPLVAQNAPPPPPPAPEGPFKLPPLPYPADALEPFIDAQTMTIHHGKHHAAYVGNLNKAVAGKPNLARKSPRELVAQLEEVPEDIRKQVRNNGGGHYNHTLFWKLLKKNNGGKPSGPLSRAIDQQFGSFSKFQEEFTKAALGVFGSGWAWLTLDGNQLKVEATPNQDSPVMQGRTALLGLDVWEHAYYLKYQNRRPEYVQAFYQVINWEFVNSRFESAGKDRK